MNYYAITSNQVWDLGDQVSLTDAEHYALNQFNINHQSGSYIIVNRAELSELIRQGHNLASHVSTPGGA